MLYIPIMCYGDDPSHIPIVLAEVLYIFPVYFHCNSSIRKSGAENIFIEDVSGSLIVADDAPVNQLDRKSMIVGDDALVLTFE